MPLKAIWSKAILHNAQGFTRQRLKPIAGAVPAGLRGALYRNGPGRLGRQDQRMGHWFDGDGAILGVWFGAAGTNNTTAAYRYVETAGFQIEEEADRLCLSGYGTQPDRWLDRFKPLKNAANTSVLALTDRLLALWEGGRPHGLDLDDLQTLGIDTVLQLPPDANYSAHYKRDPETGEIFNFGVQAGPKTTIQLYRHDAWGKLLCSNAIAFPAVPLIHDFVLAGRYLVFCIPPVRAQVLPLMLRLSTFSQALQWRPELGTEVIICDRDTLMIVTRFTSDPWFQWHFGNASELADGTISLDVVRYEDFAVNQFLAEVAAGDAPTVARSSLWRLRLDPVQGKVLANECVLDRHCEFPMGLPGAGPERDTLLSLQSTPEYQANQLFQTIGRLSHTGDLIVAPMPDGHYASEPIFAPDGDNPGWVIAVVYNGPKDRSELWIWGKLDLLAPPVCRLRLPEVIPPGFHGTWVAA
jgi:all-trans-8'-apo-beta-carotenal 15,15'-oxygenase